MPTTVIINANPTHPSNSVEVIINDPNDHRIEYREHHWIMADGAQLIITLYGKQTVSVTETVIQVIPQAAKIIVNKYALLNK